MTTTLVRARDARVQTLVILGVATAALLLYGPIRQPPNYHNFADQRTRWAVPNAADVLSNVGFAVVASWGLFWLWRHRRREALRQSWPGYTCFFISLGATAVGSAFYHLAPDNARLVWDRLPIALASAGLLAAVYAEAIGDRQRVLLSGLILVAVLSVAWWRLTDLRGHGDLRPYLLVQGLPLILIPLWQAWADRPASERRALGTAILLYAAAKLFEAADHPVYAITTLVSGHTMKHVLATLAAAWIATHVTGRFADPLDRVDRSGI